MLKDLLKFDGNNSKTPSSLFSKRYEVANVFENKNKLKDKLISNIKRLLDKPNIKTEIMATTYFETILRNKINTRSVLRFRQRQSFSFDKEFAPPKLWLLKGSGNLEIKTKQIRKNIATKMGIYLLDKKGYDLYALIKISKEQSRLQQKLKKFVNNANRQQSSNFSGISYESLLKVADYLTPQITRVCKRITFESANKPNIKITLETFPAFYPYPIKEKSKGLNKLNLLYKGHLIEHSNRIKMEIKSKTKLDCEKIQQELHSLFKRHLVHNNKETKIAYPKMIIEASKQKGSLIVEKSEQEIETKSTILNKVDIPSTLTKLREEIINSRRNSPYKLFSSDPNINIRGQAELSRTIVGWKNKKSHNSWHEVVTIIRLTKEGFNEFGYSTILKWKSDNKNRSSFVLNRDTKYEFIKNDITNSQVIKIANKKIKEPLKIVGVLRKLKYRIIVQDKDGRNFVVSLDQSKSLKASKPLLQQLEVEYIHTVLQSKKPSQTLNGACKKCISYISKLLGKYWVNLKLTNIRKIDFAASIN